MVNAMQENRREAGSHTILALVASRTEPPLAVGAVSAIAVEESR
jgi:hypothetical protein